MRTILFFLAVLVATSSATSARAQAVRTFVSAQSGSDGNPCSRSAPCRTFAYAYGQTAAGGEINTLDPGGYGSLTISKAISILSGLGEAGILVPSGGTGITIAAGEGDDVNLRGLVIEGGGTGANGITFTSGQSLTITNSVIRNVNTNGLVFWPNAVSALTVVDTLVSKVGNVCIDVRMAGISIDKRMGATLQRVVMVNGNTGLRVDGSVGLSKVVVEDSVTSHHRSDGIFVTAANAGSSAIVSVRRSSASFNGNVGFYANGASAALFLGESTALMNLNDVAVVNGGQVVTFKNNEVNVLNTSGGTIFDGSTTNRF